MRLHRHLLAATMLAVAAPVVAGPVEDFRKLQDDYWAAILKDSPLFATQVGVTTYDRDLGPLSLAEMDRQAAQSAAFLRRIEAIPATSLPESEQANRAPTGSLRGPSNRWRSRQ